MKWIIQYSYRYSIRLSFHIHNFLKESQTQTILIMILNSERAEMNWTSTFLWSALYQWILMGKDILNIGLRFVSIAPESSQRNQGWFWPSFISFLSFLRPFEERGFTCKSTNQGDREGPYQVIGVINTKESTGTTNGAHFFFSFGCPDLVTPTSTNPLFSPITARPTTPR